MSRRVRCLVTTATIGVALMVAGPARACTTLDLGCTTDALTDGVRDAVDEATDVAGGALGPVGDPIEDVVDGTVDDVTGLLDDVGGRAPDVPIDPTEPPGPDPGGGGNGDRPPRDDVAGTERPDRGSSGSITAPADETAEARAARAVRPPTLAIGTASTAQRQEPSGPRSDGVGGALLAAAPGIAVLAALFGLALAFASVQAAIDRRDPRLAAVRASDDLVRFR